MKQHSLCSTVTPSNIAVERDAPRGGAARSLHAPHLERWAHDLYYEQTCARPTQDEFLHAMAAAYAIELSPKNGRTPGMVECIVTKPEEMKATNVDESGIMLKSPPFGRVNLAQRFLLEEPLWFVSHEPQT